MIEHVEVAGEPVRLISLPAFTRKAVAAWGRFVSSDTIFGLDIESTADEGLGTYDPSVSTRLIQFGNLHEAWALDPEDPRWRKEIMRLLCNPNKRFVSHNASFDTTRVLFSFGIDLGDRSIDTLPMAALCWPGRTKQKGLKPLCDEFIDDGLSEAERHLQGRFVDLWFAQKPRKTALLPKNFEPGVSICRRPRKKGQEKCTAPSWAGSLVGYCHEHYLERTPSAECKTWAWTNIPLDNTEYLRYGCLDAVYVRRLLDILAAEVKRRKMGALSRTEQRVKRLMTATSVKGHRVDGDWTEDVLNEVGEVYADAEDRIMDATGLPAGSPKMRDWLQVEYGIRTKSLDKDHLPKLIEAHPEVEVLADLAVISEHKNLISNLRTILKHAREGDGFVHPNINTMQAHTGRMSITGPAMQTLAKKGEKGTRLRGCFIARDGHILIGADYDSQEIRIAAAESRDEALLRIVLEGLNQHVLTAESIFTNWTNKAECPDEYGAAKILDFAQQYGAMPKKIAATLTKAGIPTTEAEAVVLWQKWRHTYRGLVEWSDRVAKQRFVRNSYGRLIPRDAFGRDYANGNYIIQSTGRDVLGAAMVRLADAGWGPSFWLPIHDELVMEVPEDLAEAGCAALTEHMTTTVKGIIIPAEGEVVGTRWRGLE